MDYKKLDRKKGVAGLNLFLELIAMLFVVGILIMAFTLAGSRIEDQLTDNASKKVINDTYTALSSATDWFATFITLGAVVVLVLLVVIVIRTVRGGGLTSGGA